MTDTVQPAVGRIVHYTLTQAEADAINKLRADYHAFKKGITAPPTPGLPGADGHVVHIGNWCEAGQTYPAVVVRNFPGETAGLANLQVLLDGTDTHWVTSRAEGEGPGTWSWPERV